jgi:hypothetical protein
MIPSVMICAFATEMDSAALSAKVDDLYVIIHVNQPSSNLLSLMDQSPTLTTDNNQKTVEDFV